MKNLLRSIIATGSARERIIRHLFTLLDIPSMEDFDEKDQKQIHEWLKMSAGHRGFHAYCKARDRGFAQAIVQMPIDTEEERKRFHEIRGARIEAARLYRRAQHIDKK